MEIETIVLNEINLCGRRMQQVLGEASQSEQGDMLNDREKLSHLLSFVTRLNAGAVDLSRSLDAFCTAASQILDLATCEVWRQNAANTDWQLVGQAGLCATAAEQESAQICNETDPLPQNCRDIPVYPADMSPLLFRLLLPHGARWTQSRLALADQFAELLLSAVESTRQKADVQTLIQAKQQAEDADRSKVEFMANMSHELRTPLNAIIGFSEILSQEYFGAHSTPRYREYANDILHSAQHLLSLINDILDLSKIETGNRELLEETTELADLVTATIRLVRDRAIEKNITISIDTASQMTLYVEARAIKQILVNLFANAIKFTPAGGKISLVSTRHEKGLELTIRDNGIGIGEQNLATLFEPFRAGREALDQIEQGAGLGLAISRKLARLHDGDLTITSEQGTGTTVTLFLPDNRIIGAAQGIRPWELDC